MLPLYFFGNLHCIGMCGPLVLMLGKHRFRYYYFLGRISSFTLAGMVAGEVGAVLNMFLHKFHISALASFFFGGSILLVGMGSLLKWGFPAQKWLANRTARISRRLSLLMLRDQPFATFLFGFFTIALPCGQTVIVFSACALSGDLYVGMLNGFVFAILTSPSLFLAMHAHQLLGKRKKNYTILIGLCAMAVGTLAFFRGFAELGWIPHLIINPGFSREYHIALY